MGLDPRRHARPQARQTQLGFELGQGVHGGRVGVGRQAGVAHVVVQSVVADQARVVVLNTWGTNKKQI